MKPDSLSEYPVIVTLPLEWGDQDAFGHVNNTVYLRWAETSRIEYLDDIGLWTPVKPEGLGPILASITCDYRRPLEFPDTILVGARVTGIGNSSIQMEHRIWSDKLKTVAAEVRSTVVMVDYSTGKPVRVPEETRDAIDRLESRAVS